MKHLLAALLFLPALALAVDIVATDGGMYRVVGPDGAEVSQHTRLHTAVESAVNAAQTDQHTIEQNLSIRVGPESGDKVDIVAQDQGMYFVLSPDGTQVSQHTRLHKALQSAVEQTRQTGNVHTVEQDLIIRVEPDGETVAEPAPPPDTVDPEPSTLDQLAACDPDVVYSGGSLNDAIDAVGDSGTLGFVEDVTFTDKTQARIWSENTSGVLRICGVEKADGTKPVINAPLKSKWVFGEFNDVVVDGLELNGIGVILNTMNGPLSFHELRFDRLDFGQRGGRCLFSSYGPSAIGPAVERGGAGDDPAETSYITITNTSMRDCTGPGNYTHSVYVSRRGCVFRADNVSVEAVDGLEAFRSLCRVNVVTNSYFTNVVRESDGTLRKMRNGTMSEYGATPLDTPSCGAYILRNNTFDIHSGGGTVAAIGLRLRLSMSGCDMPNNHNLTNLTNEVPWSEVLPEVGNPHLFPVILENNTFRFSGPVSDKERIVSGWGTYPRRHTEARISSSHLDYLAAPDAWRERNVVFWKNNTVEGGWAIIHKLGLRQTQADTSDPDAWLPGDIPPVPFVETTAALPQTCEDLSYLQWWDEPGDHVGFPACP